MPSSTNTPPPDESVKRSDPFSYLLGIPFLGIAIYGVVSTIRFHNPQVWVLSGIFLVGAIACWTWVASFHLQMTAAGISFGQLFRPTRAILFDDILYASQHYGFDRTTTNVDGMNRLLIWHKAWPSEPYIIINLKMFKAEDVRNLFKVLKPFMKK